MSILWRESVSLSTRCWKTSSSSPFNNSIIFYSILSLPELSHSRKTRTDLRLTNLLTIYLRASVTLITYSERKRAKKNEILFITTTCHGRQCYFWLVRFEVQYGKADGFHVLGFNIEFFSYIIVFVHIFSFYFFSFNSQTNRSRLNDVSRVYVVVF